MVVTISHNKDKNGIEVSFPEKPSPETLAWLKENKFSWSKSGGLWYRRHNAELWEKTHQYFNLKVAPSPFNSTCDICGKVCHKFGLGTHKRMKHGIVIKKTLIYNKGGNIIQRKVSLQTPFSSKNKIIETSIEPAPVIVPDIKYLNSRISGELESVTGKDLTECKRPDGRRFYTDKDLWILYSLLLHSIRAEPRLITVLVSGPWDESNTIGKLILDFEHRFECKFDDVKRSNPNIKFSDSMQITANYPNLNYSR
jgi:hypothetical protein